MSFIYETLYNYNKILKKSRVYLKTNHTGVAPSLPTVSVHIDLVIRSNEMMKSTVITDSESQSLSLKTIFLETVSHIKEDNTKSKTTQT